MPKKVAALLAPEEPTFHPKINYRSKSIINHSDYKPIYERLDKELSRRYTKLTLMKEEFELSQAIRLQAELQEIKKLSIHKPGKKLDREGFKQNYQE